MAYSNFVNMDTNFANMDTNFANMDTLAKLLEVISLVLEREKSGSKPLHDMYTFDASDLVKKPHTLKRQLVSLINTCFLNHRFEEAAKLLWIMCQDRSCFDLVLYRGTMVILENLLPSDVNEIVEKLSSTAKDLRYINKLDVQLEYLIYVLKNNIHDLGMSKLLEKKGKGNHRPIPLLQHIYSAYCALLNYRKWTNISQGDSCSSDHKDFACKIIESFKMLIEEPGIWDVFVLKLIEMLEYYEEYDEIEQILKKYVEHNPEHINAYIYLCQHLYKHKPDSETFIGYAEVLSNLCPSDERVLMLVQIWKKLGKNMKKCLKILFYFLDYPANRSNIQAWEMLSSHLYETVLGRESNSLDIKKSFWKLRCHSWTYIHFNSSNINFEDENFKLLFHKVKILTILEPNHEFIQKVELRFPGISKSPNEEISEPNSEDLNSFHNFLDR